MTATSEPTSIYSGDTVAWTKSLGDYPAPTWVLAYSLVREGDSYTITATADGGAHAVSVPAATTAQWRPGTYRWTSYVTDGTDRHTLNSGTIVVRPNPASGGYDTRSHAQKVLAALESLIEGRAGSDVTSYSIGGRSISKMSMAELIAARSQYEAMVKKEERAERLANGTGLPRIQVRF